MKNFLQNIPYFELLIISYLLIIPATIYTTLNTNWGTEVLISETGFFELGAVYLYVIAAIMFFFGPYELPAHKWKISLLCLLFASRELDIHELITNGDFLFFPKDFKVNFPFEYSVVEIVGIVFVVGLILLTFKAYSKTTSTNLINRDKHQYMMLAGWANIGLAIILDGLGTKIFEITTYSVSQNMNLAFTVSEEVAEFFIPVCFIFGLLEYYKSRIWTEQKAIIAND